MYHPDNEEEFEPLTESVPIGPDTNRLDPLWYKRAILYEVHVRAFFDTNKDGKGDFQGLAEKIPYLKKLGVTCLWLLPFFDSPLRDDGYDVRDYRKVHPDFGTIEDFKWFVKVAHEHGIRVLIELIMNHSSDQHKWFQESRKGRDNPYSDYYVWSDDPNKYKGTRIIFCDTEKSNWTYDPIRKQYYWHRFFSHQPDLNYDNPAVVAEMMDIARFWLDIGIDGFRADAIPYLYEREGTSNENLPETHEFCKHLRRFMEKEYPGTVLLSEANMMPKDAAAYFGNGDEFQMSFHFPIMPRLFMCLRAECRDKLVDIMEQTPDIPLSCQWVMFLRNHDELTLEMVTDEEREWMWGKYAYDRRMRCNLGIRRRLFPLVENHRIEVELLNALLFSLPGTPVIYYGDEIGMGDNIYLGDRNGVRTPMQWSCDRNAGFSRADTHALYLPLVSDPVYGYQSVNVEAQERSFYSILNWMRKMIRIRQKHLVFSMGSLVFCKHPKNRAVLAYLRMLPTTPVPSTSTAPNASIVAPISALPIDNFSQFGPTITRCEYFC
eukprot:MONOS_11323.1-p1 / transcript=MONOS_11323.1 / gene=MONOS_11323 / organism=Monocercomonoides_exilis_PA203 / gene_product=maltose alpha-D-glucosyltransferase / transcript_product=maltose alpha-D-glucosyltransferase / location=Mono_scaffold00563:170-3553(+) / protein_length=547 / sequence_SO=supercontig / SO=protein_coding / is_pseudo=false